MNMRDLPLVLWPKHLQSALISLILADLVQVPSSS